MAKRGSQITEHCKELNGIIAMLAVDAKTSDDRILMASALLVNVIKLYISAKMDYEEIETVLAEAVPAFKHNLETKKKK